jgi:ring-1,2-phenylacetyl-CoA epoxidase subunit PaaE
MDKLQLKITDIVYETHNTATFYLAEISGRKIEYQAGQFITLIFTHKDEEIRRSYSLSSSPDEELLSITVKRIENGEITRYLLTYFKPGDVLTAIPPAGKFIIFQTAEQTLVYFAAGSGITPIYAQLKYLLKRPGSNKITLIYSSQSAGDAIFRDKLDEVQQQNPDRFNIIYLMSSEGKRLNNIGVERILKNELKINLINTLFYLCGPFDYMRMIQLTLVYMGVEPVQIRKENFVLETVPVTTAYTTFPPRRIRIFFKNAWHDLVAGENQSILQAALQNNINLPYSCRGGICSSCVGKCTAGKVEMVKNEVLTAEEMQEGLILTCTGHAMTDGTTIEFR